jgi:small subunit ribosomal protein S20
LPSKQSAQRSARAKDRRAERNKPIRSSVKTYVTRARKLIEGDDLDAAQQAVKQATQALDRAAQKGTIHPNNAARRKSRLMKKLNDALAATGEQGAQEAEA